MSPDLDMPEVKAAFDAVVKAVVKALQPYADRALEVDRAGRLTAEVRQQLQYVIDLATQPLLDGLHDALARIGLRGRIVLGYGNFAATRQIDVELRTWTEPNCITITRGRVP